MANISGFTGLQYNAPTEGDKSSIDKGGNANQLNTYYWLRKAIIDSRKDQYFLQLADTIGMPKHFGKEIVVYQWVPLLDDRNKNDQGLDAAGAVYANGNLYGSSKDIGVINSRLPVLGETGGRVNRVGFTRLLRKGSIDQMGFFYEFTQESMDFDTEDNVKQHLSRECMNGAVQLTEACLQKELLYAAGVEVYPGAATSADNMTGDGANPNVVTYEDLQRLDRVLTANRCSRDTKIISGSQMTDTRTIAGARVMYVGPEVTPILEKMLDPFGNPAFVPTHQYAAAAGKLMTGEIGAIGHFRIIEVPEMLHWGGAGAEATGSGKDLYKTTNDHYDVFPMLVIGSESFNTIGFQTDGYSGKFNIITKMPGTATADRVTDPYGKMGFSSIQWWYGFLCKRPEWIGLIKTIAPI